MIEQYLSKAFLFVLWGLFKYIKDCDVGQLQNLEGRGISGEVVATLARLKFRRGHSVILHRRQPRLLFPSLFTS